MGEGVGGGGLEGGRGGGAMLGYLDTGDAASEV